VFADLPTELLRDIFEHAADLDRPTALSLVLVSSPVRRWTEPALYNTVVLSTAPALRAFLAAISHKSPEFVHARVKHLGVFALGPIQSIHRVLHACTGLRTLACGFSLPGYQRTQGARPLHARLSREQHLLGLSCRDGWDTALVGPSVTHLRIHLTAPDSCSPDAPLGLARAAAHEDASTWERFARLAALTHLAVVHAVSPSTPATALLPTLHRLLAPPSSPAAAAGPPNLQLILVQVIGSACDASAAHASAAALNAAAIAAGGPALRIVAECAPLSVVRQWEDAARGGPGVWEAAEGVVRARLAAA
ncbi:hypothetical protein BKA93DRAFT_708709, partial [Sparassis latifolia]